MNSVPNVEPSGNGGFIDPLKIAAVFGISEGMRVADFGSGSGYFTIILGKMVGQTGIVTAIDIMTAALDTLRGKAKAEGLTNIETVRANLEILGSSGLSNDSQDFVLLANILFQNEKKEDILREAKRILKLGGIMVVIAWKPDDKSFGPPKELRTDQEAMRSIVTSVDFQFAGNIDAGSFHYGMIFKKT